MHQLYRRRTLVLHNIIEQMSNNVINTPLGDGVKLRLAIQKSGRLSEDSIKLLKDCSIDLRNVKDRLRTEAENFPIEIFF